MERSTGGWATVSDVLRRLQKQIERDIKIRIMAVLADFGGSHITMNAEELERYTAVLWEKES